MTIYAFKGKPPPPRLRHIKPGQVAHLKGCNSRVLERIDQHWGYFDGGFKASLCHELDKRNLQFGCGGWKVKEDGVY